MDSLKEQLSITYGDGWYSGFLAAQAIYNTDCDDLGDYQLNSILNMSEAAEEEITHGDEIDNLMVIPKQIDDATYIKICEESGVAVKQATLNKLLKVIAECQ